MILYLIILGEVKEIKTDTYRKILIPSIIVLLIGPSMSSNFFNNNGEANTLVGIEAQIVSDDKPYTDNEDHINISRSMKEFPQILWYYDLAAPSLGSAAVGDIDGDDALEIVFGTYFNDEHIYALNAENGTLLWMYNTGGCNDASPAIADVDLDGNLEVIIPASSPYRIYCFDGVSGEVKWSTSTGYPNCIDSPPAIADVDNDDKPEVIFGTFYGYVFCLNGEDGSICWQTNLGTDSYIQSGPNILDLDGNGQLDVVVAQYSGDCRIYALKGDDASILWFSDLPQDYMYHGGSFADIDEDGKPEIVIGCYDNHVYVINGEDGSLEWTYQAPYYIAAPTSIADLNNDDHFEIIFASYNILGALSHTGDLIWSYPTGGSIFRGASIADTNSDGIPDVIFGSDDGILRVLRGDNGQVIWSINLENEYGMTYNIDHAPVVADFNRDGNLDIFVIGGYATSSPPDNNHGRAYALAAGEGTGPGWPMFRYDLNHSACFESNQPPTASDDYAYTYENTAVIIDILKNDYDPDGTIDPTTVTIVTDCSHGAINVDPITGNTTYTPTTGFNGSDTFQYTVNDSDGATSNIATVHILVITSDMILNEIPLATGWNLITIPVENSYMASTLAEHITGCEVVSRWDAINQTYRSYIAGGPPGLDYPIENGHAYFILVNTSSIPLAGGYSITSVSIPLSLEWNMIGWYHTYNTTASSLGNTITGCEVVSRWDAVNQTYRSYITGGPPGLDFTITAGMGLFTLVNEESVWQGEG